ncbi:DNA-binding transcriptional regulator, IclR family [Micromonospora pallida]|uniref:DNA-binding transcriptional regulator, IclR family n=1 Tax=Micromonospora pallida TaxID=145854 RepID=A0A1C6RX43_9ACTN|nr:IclR family transcriptional regulator [Micromonospora pallida]SCL21782.1 DNA-binding transcriptional regulator, IclR family [Micromonospora pallida]
MSDTGARPRSPLQTVDRALEVLLSFTERRRDWGVLELAEAFAIDKSSAQRILAALAARGFLSADPVTRRYSLGPTMWRMAAVWERTGGLAALAQRVLEPLAFQTDRTAIFAVPDGLHVRCVAAVNGGGPLRSHPLVGELYPANAGATSRAYFAFLDSNERRALISGRVFATFTELTRTDEHELERLFVEAVAQGYAYSEGEYDYATRALAVPIMLRGRPVGSLSLGESKYPARPDDIRDHLPALQTAAEQLSALLDNRANNSAVAVRQTEPTKAH